MVLVRVDVISIPRHVYTDIKNRLLSEGLIAEARYFVLAQSHTHHGPMVGRIPDPYILLGGSEQAVEETNRFTVGDLNPVGVPPGGNENMVQSYGNQVADAVVAMVRSRALIPVTGPFTTDIETVQLPFSVNMNDNNEVAELRAKYVHRTGNLGDTGGEGAAKRHAERLLAMIDNGSVPRSMPMTIQRLSLGGLTILTMAHEVLSGYHVGTKRKFGKPLWIMGYANHTDCYVAADDKLWSGGYEAGWNGNDSKVPGIDTAGISYSLPAPLKASPQGQPGHPDATEGLVAASIARLLGV